MRPDKTPRPANRRTPWHCSQETRADLRRTAALDLRLAGHSLRAIAARLGVHHSTVDGYLKTSLEDHANASTANREDLRAIEHARLESLVAQWFPIATGEGVDLEARFKAAHILLKLGDSTRQLSALDEPKRQVTPDRPTFETLAVLRARLAERKAALGEGRN